ncbi:hypothetical protein ABT317_34595, partial [Streptomyces carpinensis]
MRTLAWQGADGSWEAVLAPPHPRLRPGVLGYRGIRVAGPRRRLETPIGAVRISPRPVAGTPCTLIIRPDDRGRVPTVPR